MTTHEVELDAVEYRSREIKEGQDTRKVRRNQDEGRAGDGDIAYMGQVRQHSQHMRAEY